MITVRPYEQALTGSTAYLSEHSWHLWACTSLSLGFFENYVGLSEAFVRASDTAMRKHSVS